MSSNIIINPIAPIPHTSILMKSGARHARKNH